MKLWFEEKVALVCRIRQGSFVVFGKKITAVVLDVTCDGDHGVGAELGDVESNATNSFALFDIVKKAPSSCGNGRIVAETNVGCIVVGEREEDIK